MACQPPRSPIKQCRHGEGHSIKINQRYRPEAPEASGFRFVIPVITIPTQHPIIK